MAAANAVEESLEAVAAWRMSRNKDSAPSLFGLRLDVDTLIAGMVPSATTPGARTRHRFEPARYSTWLMAPRG